MQKKVIPGYLRNLRENSVISWEFQDSRQPDHLVLITLPIALRSNWLVFILSSCWLFDSNISLLTYFWISNWTVCISFDLLYSLKIRIYAPHFISSRLNVKCHFRETSFIYEYALLNVGCKEIRRNNRDAFGKHKANDV